MGMSHGVTFSFVVWAVVPRVAVIPTVALVVTAFVLTVADPDVLPAPIVMVDGLNDTTDALLEVRLKLSPPDGAADASVTVAVALLPPLTVEGLIETLNGLRAEPGVSHSGVYR